VFCPRCGDEYREGFTWCHDCEVALVAAPPAEAPPPPLVPVEPPSAEEIEEQARSVRLQGLGLVLLTTLAGPLVALLESWLGNPPRRSPDSHDAIYGALSWITVDLVIFCLMAYVLFRQGRGLRQLGLTARGSDLAWGLALVALGILPWTIEDLVIRGALGSWLVSPTSGEGMSLLEFASLLCDNVKLWLVLGAYPFTELRALSGRATLALVTTVGLQELYMQYQLAGVVTLLIFSLFYWRTGRATSVLLGGVGTSLWFWLHLPPIAS
jgi:hypothetical protein